MNCFDNIHELPIIRYHKIIEDSTFKPLLIKQRKSRFVRKIDKFIGNSRILGRIWEDINVDIIDQFGVSHDFEAIFYKQNTINKLEIEILLGDNTKITTCELLKMEIDQLKSKTKQVKDIKKYHARLHRILQSHFSRDTHNLSTFEFFNDLQDLKNEQEKENNKSHLKVKYA